MAEDNKVGEYAIGVRPLLQGPSAQYPFQSLGF